MVTKTLVSSEHAFDDFDISGMPGVHRACVRHDIKEGDTFNVYCDQGHKFGAVWLGSVEKSLESFAIKHTGYKSLLKSK